jgi:hypothetical protein
VQDAALSALESGLIAGFLFMVGREFIRAATAAQMNLRPNVMGIPEKRGRKPETRNGTRRRHFDTPDEVD